MTRSCVGILLVVALVAGGAASVRAQGLTGQITGTITDAGGGVMPGVTVVATNAGTNQRRETITGPEGTFLFPDLLAGTYDIAVRGLWKCGGHAWRFMPPRFEVVERRRCCPVAT